MWQVRRTPRGLELNVSVASFRRLRRIRRRTGVRLRIIERHGLPFVLSRVHRRPLLLAGAFVFLAAAYLLSSMVWFVRIEGARRLDPDLLREVCVSQGLEPGVWKWSLDPRRVERGLLLAVNGLSWVAVEIHGVVAVVKVVEKNPIERPDIIVPPADVVAAKDGVITSIIVLAGRAVVGEGATVKKGDLLILGRQPVAGTSAPEGGETELQAAPAGEKDVVAKGIVRARVWYQAYAEAPLHTLSHVPTGKTWRRADLVVAGRTIPLFGWWRAPTGLYERHRDVLGFPWRTAAGTVELVLSTFMEVRDERRDLSPAEAEQVARDAAGTALAGLIPQGVQPVSFHFEVTRRDAIVIGVVATAEVVEDIARTKPRH